MGVPCDGALVEFWHYQAPMLLGYARVSTQDQHLEPQLDALKADGVDVERIYTDKATGANSDRPGLVAVLKALRKGDTLVVVKLDRLARSMKHLIELGEAIQARGAALRVLDAGIDTGTPVGRLTFHIICASACNTGPVSGVIGVQ